MRQDTPISLRQRLLYMESLLKTPVGKNGRVLSPEVKPKPIWEVEDAD